ncbi:4Fe-4S binding protein [Deltaproteobacteria bacterium TL4]
MGEMKKKYWNEPEMGLWERFYFFEIGRGLCITSGVFFGNMFKWLTFRKGALTVYYPEETREDYSPKNRGRHVLVMRENGKPQCVACNMCATVCPAGAIEIEAAQDLGDQIHPKSPVKFELDYSRCVFCGFCVEACPEDAIRMDITVNNFPVYDRSTLWTSKEELLTWNPQKDSKKVYK